MSELSFAASLCRRSFVLTASEESDLWFIGPLFPELFKDNFQIFAHRARSSLVAV